MGFGVLLIYSLAATAAPDAIRFTVAPTFISLFSNPGEEALAVMN